MDARTEGLESRTAMGKSVRGTKKRDKDDGAAIQVPPLAKGLRNLQALKKKLEAAGEALRDAIKAIAEQTGLNVSTVRRMVNAQSRDFSHYEDEKRKVEQLAVVFEEIGYEGEITKETTAPGSEMPQ